MAAPLSGRVDPIPTNPRDLAADWRLRDGSWRDPHDRNLFQVLVEQLGLEDARRLWHDAAVIAELTPSGLPLATVRRQPSLVDRVWIPDVGSVEVHDPVPDEQVTVCGIETEHLGYVVAFSHVAGRVVRLCLTCFGPPQ